MRIVVPYNEILPKRKAHDLFLMHEAAALAEASCDLHLLCGAGSLTDVVLLQHYAVTAPLTIDRLPILRKNLLNLSWNLPFFFMAQRKIEELKPGVVLLSVLKQAYYHLKRKVKGVKYVYEVHEISTYPNSSLPSEKLKMEREVLRRADLITVTTHQLKKILQAPPYSIQTAIEVLPLAVSYPPLAKKDKNSSFTVAYVGQLYREQGVEELIEAMEGIDHLKLKIIGGKQEEIARLKKCDQIEYLGFVAPSQLQEVIADVDAFVAPFQLVGRMPYVAHTKLYEYAAWGRPIIAPDSPIVREHFPDGKGVLLYRSQQELKECLKKIHQVDSKPQKPLSWEQRTLRLLSAIKCARSQNPHV